MRAKAYRLERTNRYGPWRWLMTLLVEGKPIKGLFKTKKDALAYLED